MSRKVYNIGAEENRVLSRRGSKRRAAMRAVPRRFCKGEKKYVTYQEMCRRICRHHAARRIRLRRCSTAIWKARSRKRPRVPKRLRALQKRLPRRSKRPAICGSYIRLFNGAAFRIAKRRPSFSHRNFWSAHNDNIRRFL